MLQGNCAHCQCIAQGITAWGGPLPGRGPPDPHQGGATAPRRPPCFAYRYSATDMGISSIWVW